MTEIESADNNIPDDASSVYSEYVPSVHSSDEEDNVSSSCPSSCAPSDTESTDQYTKHDFPDLKITPGQLQRFNDAYEEFLEFVASAAGSTDREPMLLEKPNQLRPLPQTLQDFMVQMPLVNIGSAAVNHKNEIEKRLIRCVDMNAIKDRDCAEEVLKAERKQMDQQLTVFEAVCNGCDKVAHQQQWEKLFQLLLVSCTVLFDENAHLLFGQHSPVERVSDILNRLGKCWRAVFAQPHGVLKLVDESITTSLRKWLLSSQQDLNEGAYSEVGPHANPFRLVRFPFEPIKGEELNFDASQPSSPKSKKSDGSGPKDGKTERPGGSSVPAETPDLPGKKTLDRNDSTATFDLPDIQNPAATLARHNSWETKPSDFVVHPLTGVAIHEAIKKDDDDDDSDVEEVVDDDDEPVQREEDDIPITTPTAKDSDATPPGSAASPSTTKIFAKLSEIAQDEANPITKQMGQYLTAEESQAKTKPAKKRKRTYVAPWERGKEQPPAKQQPAPPQAQEQSQSSQNAALSRFLQTQQTLSNPPMPPNVAQQQSRLAMQQQQQANAQQMVSQQLAQQQAMQQQAIQQQQQQAMQMNMMMAQQPMQFAMPQQQQFALPQVVMSSSAMNVPMGAYLTQPMQQQASPAGTPQSQTQTYVQSPQFMSRLSRSSVASSTSGGSSSARMVTQGSMCMDKKKD